MSVRRGPRWVDRNEINRDLRSNEMNLILRNYCSRHWYSGTRMPRRVIRLRKFRRQMSLASGILFMIWVSIVMVGIGSYAMMTIIKQEKSLYSNWEDSDDDTFQDGVG